MKTEMIRMQKQARNHVILFEAQLQLQDQANNEDDIEPGTPMYKKNARLKQGNFKGIQKQTEKNSGVSTAINSDVEDLDKQEEWETPKLRIIFHKIK